MTTLMCFQNNNEIKHNIFSTHNYYTVVVIGSNMICLNLRFCVRKSSAN